MWFFTAFVLEEAVYKEYREVYPLLLSGVSVNCCCRFPDTAFYLRKFLDCKESGGQDFAKVSDTSFKDWKSAGNADSAFAEFCMLCQPVSELLLRYDRCVFHAAALRFRNKAILISGGSGAGKSTYCRLLLERYPTEFSVINGDKPILEYTGSEVVVHPSPWNGKEGLHGAEAAQLAALYILRRSDDNTIEKCSDKEAAIFSFPMIFQSFETEKVIRDAGKMTEKIVRGCTHFIFNTREIEESSSILYQSIRKAINHGI